MIVSPYDIKGQDFEGTGFECGSSRQETDWLVECNLRDCELRIVEPCWTRFLNCTFRDCVIIAQKESRQTWEACRWINCKFVGDYCSAVFGYTGRYCALAPGSMLVDCDFSDTNLHGCAFFNAELTTIKYPKWPNVTILDPKLHQSELRSLRFSPIVQIWWDIYSAGIYESNTSKTFNWDRVVKARKESEHAPQDFQPYADEVRSIIGCLPYVIL
jgi:uncharacterized protein YjbI with pentapeptide repeats